MVRNYFNPISYHFYFCGASDMSMDQRIIPAVIDSLREIKPYVVELAKISDQWALSVPEYPYACSFKAENAEENFDHYLRQFEANPLTHAHISHVPRQIPDKLKIQLDSMDKGTAKNRVKTSFHTKKFDLEDVRKLLCCPSDDLRDILYPIRQVNYGFFKFNYISIPFSQTLAGKTHGEGKGLYMHQLYIEIPRPLCDYMGQVFPLQEAWTQRLKALCDLFDPAVGCVKMDATSSNNPSALMNWTDAFHAEVLNRKLTGYAWVTCVSRQQLQTMGGIDQVRAWDVFHNVLSLNNGGALLQLTPNVEYISRETNARMVHKIRPFLKLGECSYDEIPPSFRFELEKEDIIQYTAGGKNCFCIMIPC